MLIYIRDQVNGVVNEMVVMSWFEYREFLFKFDQYQMRLVEIGE